MVRACLTTPAPTFMDVDGRKVIARGQAVWRLPDRDFFYADFELAPGSLAFNVRPGE